MIRFPLPIGTCEVSAFDTELGWIATIRKLKPNPLAAAERGHGEDPHGGVYHLDGSLKFICSSFALGVALRLSVEFRSRESRHGPIQFHKTRQEYEQNILSYIGVSETNTPILVKNSNYAIPIRTATDFSAEVIGPLDFVAGANCTAQFLMAKMGITEQTIIVVNNKGNTEMLCPTKEKIHSVTTGKDTLLVVADTEILIIDNPIT